MLRTKHWIVRACFRRLVVGAGAVFASMLAPIPAAFAQATLTAHYTLSFARITIGNADIAAKISPDSYSAIATGRASGFLRILLSGEGSVSAQGTISEERLIPSAVTARLKDEDESSAVSMTLDNGNVKDLTVDNSAPEHERVRVTADHRRNIIDPLSAILVRAGNGEALGAQTCRRTLPIFDGRRRYDLKLEFKRIDQVKTHGYQGPALVCAVAFHAIAGHRVDSALVSYLSEGRNIELWLAPIAGTRVLAPFRLSISNLIGDMVLEATAFETAKSVPVAPAPANSRSAL